MRRLGIHAGINPKLPLRDGLKLIGPALGDYVAFPERDGTLGDPKGLSQRRPSSEMCDRSRYSHGPKV
jgi:hypothetical protein